jgi:hypothetical protein
MRATTEISGALLFGRYAFPPNRLGYCGPDDHQALFEHVSERQAGGALLALERRFDGAYPYLRLIAQATGIGDPFDRRVVEAYWLGNSTLDRVDLQQFAASLDERFKKRMSPRAFGWLSGKIALGARPHHNFHVFDVYLKAGLTRDERAPITLERMDACRISWGTVVAVAGPELIVTRQPLVLREGKLALGEAQTKQILRQIDGRGFADDAAPGDVVSIHWNWACEVLDAAHLRRLQDETQRSLAIANTTI